MDEDDALTEVWQEDKRAEIEERQDNAYRLLLIYQQRGGDDDNLTAIKDLIANLLHLADQYGMLSADTFLASAKMHYDAEREEAGLA